jgi:hypothetical protein
MRKLAIFLMGLIFALSLTGLAFAQEKAKPAKPAEAAKPAEPPKAAEAAKPEVAKKEAAPKPAMYRMGGVVVALDTAAKKITIKQDGVKKQKKVALSVGKKAAKDLAGINVGDGVNVWVSGKTVTNLKKVF